MEINLADSKDRFGVRVRGRRSRKSLSFWLEHRVWAVVLFAGIGLQKAIWGLREGMNYVSGYLR